MKPDLKQAIAHIRNHAAPRILDSFLISLHNREEASCPHGQNSEERYTFFETEKHDFFEVALVLEGTFLFKLGGSRHMAHPHQVCLIDKQLEHQIGWMPDSGQPLTILWLACRSHSTRLHLTRYDRHSADVQYSCDLFRLDEYLPTEIIRELKEQKDGWREASLAFLTAYLTLVQRRLDQFAFGTGMDGKQRIVAETRQFIDGHLNAKISLGDIANAVSVSPSYLSLLFKQVTGQPIGDYIQEVRIEKAKELLAFSDRKLSDIAETLGFCDQFYFSKVFKQATGLSPSNYRNYPG